jgi:hypothetical protein
MRLLNNQRASGGVCCRAVFGFQLMAAFNNDFEQLTSPENNFTTLRLGFSRDSGCADDDSRLLPSHR